MNKLNYIFIIATFSYAQNFLYSEDDWFTINSPDLITSITNRYDKILFSSLNGIYVYDDVNNEFYYSNHLNKELLDEKIHIIHFDQYRDHIWILTSNAIMYKSFNSNIWRTINFFDIQLSSHNNVYNIASNENYIILESHIGFILLDPYTGLIIEPDFDMSYQIQLANWSSSSGSLMGLQIDLTDYFSIKEWNIYSYKKLEKNGRIITITTSKEDDNDNIWLGSETGEIFIINKHSRIIEEFESLPLSSNIKLAYLDDDAQWWIADNDWVYLETKYLYEQEIIFLSNWNEYDNKWIPYHQNKYPHIQSKDINCIIKKNNWLYIGTTYGLLIYDLIDERWTLFEESNGLSNSINDMIFFDKNLYIGTDKGIYVFSTIINKPIGGRINNSAFKVYDLEILDNSLLIVTNFGFYEIDLINNSLSKISDTTFEKIKVYKNDIYLIHNNRIVQYINKNNQAVFKKKFNFHQVRNMDVCDNYIWVHGKNKAGIYNINSNDLLEYDYLDGIPGTSINDIACDSDWVWFITNNGLTFYNWYKYHNESK